MQKVLLAVVIILNFLALRPAWGIPFHIHGNDATTWEKDNNKGGDDNFHPNNPALGNGDQEAGNTLHQHYDATPLRIVSGDIAEDPHSIRFAWDNRELYGLELSRYPVVPHGFINESSLDNIPRYQFLGKAWTKNADAMKAQPIIIEAFNQWSALQAEFSPVSGLPLTTGLEFTKVGPKEQAEIQIFWDKLTIPGRFLPKLGGNEDPPGLIRTRHLTFNSRIKNWHFGAAAATPVGMLHFGSVALHEVGHVVGLGHSKSETSRMFSGIFEGTRNAFDVIDEESKKAAYALYSIPETCGINEPEPNNLILQASLTASGCKDFGDAPNSYKTFEASDGPRYQEGNLQGLGQLWDKEPDGQPTPRADGDDSSGGCARCRISGDDEDGVIFGNGSVDVIFRLTRPATEIYNLSAWWDRDKNNLFDHPSERRIFDNFTIADLLPFDLEKNLYKKHYELGFDPKKYYSRFRLTWNPSREVLPSGEVPSNDGISHGEVQDYAPRQQVPESNSVLGLLAVGGLGLIGMRKKQKPINND